jgi:hypothetical protein
MLSRRQLQAVVGCVLAAEKNYCNTINLSTGLASFPISKLEIKIGPQEERR